MNPDIYTGTSSLTVRGTMELKIPIVAPCMSLPISRVFMDCTRTKSPATKAIILAMKKDCLIDGKCTCECSS